MRREQIIESMKTHDVFDVVIVGGGATGLGVALEAALRGFRVAVFDSHDFAGGTSSRATKLLHGGVRYLAQGNISLVREALTERTNVLHNAPHLAQPLPFVMPSYAWWQQPFYGIGLMLYDLMAGKAGLGRTRFLSASQTRDCLPGVNPQGLRGGVLYWDGQFDDARLALAIARTAEQAGACLLNHANVLRVAKGNDPLYTVEVSDRFHTDLLSIKARCVINATGVWVDTLRMQTTEGGVVEQGVRPMVSPSQGVHVVVDQSFLGRDHALLVPRTRDGRVLFAVPWMGKLILGTTDTPRQDIPREPRPFDDELRFILQESAGVLSRAVKPDDVRSVWVGLRPLVAAQQADSGATKTLSREHTILVGRDGMVTVTGGKWTTYRAMAEDVMTQCFEAGLLPHKSGPGTERYPLMGANPGETHPVPIHAPPGRHLYGCCAPEVDRCEGAEHHLGMGLTEAMVRYGVRHEYARTVEDILARRWRALFLDATAAANMAPAVARLLTEEGVVDPGLESFLRLCDQYRPVAQLRQACGA